MLRVWAVVALSGCLTSSSVTCKEGLVCPSGTTCVELTSQGREVCAAAADVTACAGAADRAPCSTSGNCVDGVCLHHCGDGVRTGSEQCDGADLGSATNCADLHYYSSAPLTCTPDCTYDVVGDYSAGCQGYCGDGMVNGPELCEDNAGWTDPRTCVDFGLDAGDMTCARCGPSFATCKTIGLPRAFTKTGALHGRAADDVWLVGSTHAWHYDGTTWSDNDLTAVETGVYGAYSSVWVESAGHAWIAGGVVPPPSQGGGAGTAQIAYWDGTAWSSVPVSGGGALNAIWAAGNGEAWAVGATGTTQPYAATIVHAVGGSAEAISTPAWPELRAVWGSAANDVWAVGDTSAIVHYDGTGWTQVSSPVAASFRSIYGTSATNVWAIGGDSSGNTIIIHRTASGWTSVPAPPSNQSVPLGAIWTDGTYVWAAGYEEVYQYDGAIWTPVLTTVQVGDHGLWGSSAGDIWLSVLDNNGSQGLDHYKGAAWGRWVVTNASIGSVWFDGARIWASGATVEVYDGTTWSSSSLTGTNSIRFWSASPSDIWAVRTLAPQSPPVSPMPMGEIDHFNGTSWTTNTTFTLPPQTPGDASFPPTAIWGSGPSDVWAVGSSAGYWHYDGSAWTRKLTSGAIAVWGTAANDVWAADTQGDVFHYDGAGWTTSRTGTASDNISALWASSPSDVWAVGNAVYHYDGTTWTTSMQGTFYYAIAGTGPSDVFLLSNGDSLQHWDGIEWTPVRLGFDDTGVAIALWAGGHHVFLGSSSGIVVDLERSIAW